ncbi:MAG: NADH-quinone oxidoreductase subunit C [Rhodomicrobium sp.]
MTRLPEDLDARLDAAAPGGIDFSSTATLHGVVSAWCGLANSADLVPVAKELLALGARLSMVSARQLPAPEEEEEEEAAEGEAEAANPEKVPPKTFGGTPLDGTSYEIDYHFDLGGDTLTVIAYVPAGGSIASLTPYFRPADWPEREMMEMYSIAVPDHPDPRRLFVDPSIDKAVLERLIPYSVLVNAASTKALWDKVLSAKGGAS